MSFVFERRYADHVLRMSHNTRVLAAFGGSTTTTAAAAAASAAAAAAAAAFTETFLHHGSTSADGRFELKTLDNCRQFSQRIYPLDSSLAPPPEEQRQHISAIEWLLQQQQQQQQQQHQFTGIKLVVIASPDAFAAAGRTLSGAFARALGVHVVPADAFQPGHLQLGLCIVQGAEVACAEVVEFVMVEQELLPQQLLSIWVCPSPFGSHQCQMHSADGSNCLIFHSNSPLPVLADLSSFAIAEAPLESNSWLTSIAAPDAPWKQIIGRWLLALAPTLHIFAPILPLPYDFTVLADLFMSHPNIESVVGIEEHRIAIIDLPFTHPDFPALFETCCREAYTRIVLCTQCVGFSQAQNFRDEVMRVASGVGRETVLHGLVPSSTGDSDNAFAPAELITHLLCALEEGLGVGREVVQKKLGNFAEFARETCTEAPHGCTARSAILAELADGLGGLLTALPVLSPDVPMQWSAMPQQLHPLLQKVLDKNGRRDGSLEQEAYTTVLPLSHIIQPWLTPMEWAAAALAHAIRRALCFTGLGAWDHLMHCFSSKNFRECFANKLVIRVLAQDATDAAAAAVSAAAANVTPGPANVVRGPARLQAQHAATYSGLLNSNASR